MAEAGKGIKGLFTVCPQLMEIRKIDSETHSWSKAEIEKAEIELTHRVSPYVP